MFIALPTVSVLVFLVMVACFGLVMAVVHAKHAPRLPGQFDPDAEFHDLCEKLRHPIRRQMRRVFRSRNQ